MDRLMVAVYRWLWLPIRVKQKLIWLLNPKYCVGVLAFISHPKIPNQILLADHPYRGEISWSLPGGLVGRKEPPEDALQREVWEELGVEVKVHQLMQARLSAVGVSLDLVYSCRLVDDHPSFELGREVAGVAFFDLNQLPEAQMHSQHVALIHLLARQNSAD